MYRLVLKKMPSCFEDESMVCFTPIGYWTCNVKRVRRKSIPITHLTYKLGIYRKIAIIVIIVTLLVFVSVCDKVKNIPIFHVTGTCCSE